jgi:broad specificity phosphatase PhoE
VLFATTLGVAPAVSAQEARTVVILVRHAERAESPDDDPALTPDGEARARELARLLSDAGVDAIYTSQYRRTTLTAEPLAQQLGLDIRVTRIENGADAFARSIARSIHQLHTGQTVLVVSHSNTVPLIARALGAADPGPIAESDYDNLFIVIVGPGETRELIRARF